VSAIARDASDAGLVASIFNLAHNLKRSVIAEGVETVDQLDYLRGHGCDELQGYYVSRPLPAHEFEQFLRKHNGLSPVNASPTARASPSFCTRSQLRSASGTSPILLKAWMKLAVGPATAIAQVIGSDPPGPSRSPFTGAHGRLATRNPNAAEDARIRNTTAAFAFVATKGA